MVGLFELWKGLAKLLDGAGVSLDVLSATDWDVLKSALELG